MRYRVIDKKTKEDITDKYDWVISSNGQLSYNDYGDLIGYPEAAYLPEVAMDEFYKSVKTLKNLNYYNNNSEKENTDMELNVNKEEVRSRNVTNISNELEAIERQIEYFNDIEYSSCLNHYCGNSTPYPFSGLDEEDFYYIKKSLVKMLNDCHNKKSQELIDFLQNNKK